MLQGPDAVGFKKLLQNQVKQAGVIGALTVYAHLLGKEITQTAQEAAQVQASTLGKLRVQESTVLVEANSLQAWLQRSAEMTRKVDALKPKVEKMEAKQQNIYKQLRSI